MGHTQLAEFEEAKAGQEIRGRSLFMNLVDRISISSMSTTNAAG